MANRLRNLGAGLLRGATADVLGMPVDTLNMLREGLLAPSQSGNPYARQLTGLLGPVAETGSGDWFAQQMGLPQGEGLLYEGARMVSPSPTDLMSLARRAPIQELITYHGSPHRFEPTPANPLGEFEASKIGSGEGAQAYGHGVYLAENPKIAEEYRKQLAGGTDQGSLYAADLPDEMIDRMLDWDKEFSKQPESVKNAIKQSGLYKEYKENLSNFASPMITRNKTARGENFLSYLEYKLGGNVQASEYLKSLGIPGIKYLDQGSRNAGKGTRNFVVFPGEEKKVKILKRD